MDESLGDCEPVPSDEVLDLVDERSASESEVCLLACMPCIPKTTQVGTRLDIGRLHSS
jgi:hypothetical protein